MKYVAFLTAATLLRPGEATPSATMRLMEHLHGSEVGSPASSTPDGLYVSKRAWVEDRACTRLSRTPHLITTARKQQHQQQPPWFPSAVDLAEGFYLPDVAAFAC
eukprot:TRINITY_DN12652_c0_g1_i1.p2 TRINITY_DN12652_c0_g1~~TRINITY_DN12652_c0_g1_i1.p2  ORF type:complete len:105 (+),score=16.14 TRINITY_DN12652_c0_g1_i1:41-355(+)